MSVETLNCNECGALIQAPPAARYLTCNRCGAHLVVRRTDVATFTESAPPPGGPRAPEDEGARWRDRGRDDDPRWRDMAARLDDLAYENALMRLDREWEFERERYMMSGRYGYRYVPSPTTGIVFMVLGGMAGLAVIVVVLYSLAANQPGGLFCVIMPGIFTLAFGLGGLFQYQRGKQYQAAYDDYRRRREALLRGEDDPGWRRDGDPPMARRPSSDDDD
jgi:hypothetical protein